MLTGRTELRSDVNSTEDIVLFVDPFASLGIPGRPVALCSAGILSALLLPQNPMHALSTWCRVLTWRTGTARQPSCDWCHTFANCCAGCIAKLCTIADICKYIMMVV